MTDKEIEQEIKYLKESCIEAGKELSKYSYAWDGKEKNLVVSVMKLNRMYEESKQQLHHKEQECKELKRKNVLLQNHNQQLDGAITEAASYKQALEKIEEQIALYQALTISKPRTMRENDCLYKINDILNEILKCN